MMLKVVHRCGSDLFLSVCRQSHKVLINAWFHLCVCWKLGKGNYVTADENGYRNTDASKPSLQGRLPQLRKV